MQTNNNDIQKKSNVYNHYGIVKNDEYILFNDIYLVLIMFV